MPKKTDAPEGATKTRAPRKPALPAELVQKIDEYAAAESVNFKKVNKGAMVKALQAHRETLISAETATIDRKLADTEMADLLEVITN